VVAALESYIGLVEVGVGLLPAGGGLKEIAQRANAWAKGGDAFPELGRLFRQVAMADVSKSAEHAREMGYLKPADVVVLHPAELLYVARQQARAMAESGHRPPLAPARIPVAGSTGIATLKMMLVNMKEGGFISEHDYEIGSRIATVVCGGEVEPGSLVDEAWLLDLERHHFVELAKTEKTQARIEHMSRPASRFGTSHPAPRARPMGKLGSVAFCLLFAVVFGGVGVFASWAIASTVLEAQRAKDWVRVKASVDDASLDTSRGSKEASPTGPGAATACLPGREYAGIAPRNLVGRGLRQHRRLCTRR